jgi:hypothetical protein
VNDTRLIVPPLEAEPWPTLGPEVCDWMEAHLVHGPGDILGQPAQLTDEFRLLLYRAYEVYPRGHRLAGRRRFKRIAHSRRKGVAKTEQAAWIGITELDPSAPVRCDGFRKEGGVWVPVGRPIHDPYIPMVATTEEQTEELAYGAAVGILENCALGNEYDIGLERIMHRSAPGKMLAMASAPKAADGRRTTFQHFDETHLFIEQRLLKTHSTMLRNIPKRRESDPWSLESTTSYCPGEGSVAEATHRLALAIIAGKASDPTLLFDHRQASEKWDIGKKRELLEAIKEASGDAWEFTDVEAIMGLLVDVDTHGPDFRRYFLNQATGAATKMFNAHRWEALGDPRDVPPDTPVVLAFDGSYARDSTGIVGATIEQYPYLFVVEAWEAPLNDPNWRTPRLEVDAAIDEAMERWRVRELACDPPGWTHEVEEWADRYGDVVTLFDTARPSMMGPAADAFMQAYEDGELVHDADPRLARHVANCVPAKRRGYRVPTKESDDSPNKIDLAVGAIIGFARGQWHHVNSRIADPWVIRR